MDKSHLTWYVITPFAGEPDNWLRKCCESVRKQESMLESRGFSVRMTHVVVGDGYKLPTWLGSLHGIVPVDVGVGLRDFGDTPRAIGSVIAISKRADIISFLDADNWFSSDHCVEVLAAHQASSAPVVSATRSFYNFVGEPLEANCLTSNGKDFIDTNCLNLFGEACSLALKWCSIDPEEHAIDDRVIFDFVRQSGVVVQHIPVATVCYRATVASIYTDLGETPPKEAKNNDRISKAVRHFENRTGRSAALSWRYEIPINAISRVLKLVAAMRKRGKQEQAERLLAEALKQLPAFQRQILESAIVLR